MMIIQKSIFENVGTIRVLSVRRKSDGMEYKSKIIRDKNGTLWRFSPEKGRVKSEEDDDVFGGYYVKSYEEAVAVLKDNGYI